MESASVTVSASASDSPMLATRRSVSATVSTTMRSAVTILANWSVIAMVSATVFFLLAAIVDKDSFDAGNVSAGPFVLTVIGFGLLTLGGWLGGTIVFVHGMRVLTLVEEPAGRAASPLPEPEEEAAER